MANYVSVEFFFSLKQHSCILIHFFSVTFGAINFLNLSCKFSWHCMIGLLLLIKSSLEMTCGEWRLLVSTLVGEYTGPAHSSRSRILEPMGMPQDQSVWPLIALPDIRWSDKPVFNDLSWEFVVFTWHWHSDEFSKNVTVVYPGVVDILCKDCNKWPLGGVLELPSSTAVSHKISTPIQCIPVVGSCSRCLHGALHLGISLHLSLYSKPCAFK